MFLTGKFTGGGTVEDAAVRLLDAHIGGSLHCTGATLRNDSGPALTPTTCRSARPCSSPAGSPPPALARTARSACSAPTSAASFDCTGATLRNDSGPALNADDLQVGQDMYLPGGFTATGLARTARSACSAPTSAAARLHRGEPEQ